MATRDTPTVARRRVRLAIRQAREAASLTQQQVADEMEWSLSKVIRIESGEVSIAPNDLRPLLSLLGIRDRAQITALLADSKIARTRQRQAWYQAPEYREHLSNELRQLIEYEADAVTIRYYSIYFMPGPLQIPEYADALMRLWVDEMSQERRKALLDARQLRRQTLLSRAGSVNVLVLLDESVLMRPIGGEKIFADQLRELYRLATQGLAKIRYIPFSLEAPVTNNATFDLVSLGEDDSEGVVMYHESGMADELVDDKDVTTRHRSRFDKVWHDAADEDNTTEFLKSRIKSLEASGGNS